MSTEILKTVFMMKLLYSLYFLGILLSCKGESSTEKPYNVRSDIRFGSRFFSIYLNGDGKAFVVKGSGSHHTEELRVESSDTSEVFALDSAKVFLVNLNRIKEKPVIETGRLGVPRVEIYYNEQKIYDAYKWDEAFWDLFRPIMTQLPKGFNPFRADDKPFG